MKSGYVHTHRGLSLYSELFVYLTLEVYIYICSIVNSLELCATTIVASSANRSRIHAGLIILRASDVSISLSLSLSFPTFLFFSQPAAVHCHHIANGFA